ncbi:uncharacterized protein LOC121872931 isoform X1 [Homarus americanus]|uniref:uncharacterized protein LOC121872931 isoform X1 n=1 Tax=Homarus americanus TaxID=6706 RepID=UPI001C48A714|nr:uncharacterized protein LOC121872931 isoform X1 [Homarus americanus]XP_042231997.1 uncharacterized protein LOC121872931 isoform X1 [Homarus americanus]
MASIPKREEVFVFDYEVTPGWTYNGILKKFSPCEQMNNIRTQLCPPRFDFEIRKKGELDYYVRESDIWRKSEWVQEFRNIKTGDVILLKGSKIIEKKGDNVLPHHQTHIVSSVNFKYNADMLIHFSCLIADDMLSDLKKYLLTVVNSGKVNYIPLGIVTAFTRAYIYPRGGKGKELTSCKHSLLEFCRHLRESEATYPYTAYLLTPVPCTTSSEPTPASGLNNTMKNNCTIVPNTDQKQNLVHLESTLISSNDKVKNQQATSNENNSRLRGLCSSANKGVQRQTSNRSITRNYSNLHNPNIMLGVGHGGNGRYLRKEKHPISAEKTQGLQKEGKSCKGIQPVEVHKSHRGSNPRESLEDKLQILGKDKVSHLPGQTKCQKCICPDGKCEKENNVNPGIDKDPQVREIITASRTTIQKQKENYNASDYFYHYPSSMHLAPNSHVVQSVNQTISSSSIVHENIEIPHTKDPSHEFKEDGASVQARECIKRCKKPSSVCDKLMLEEAEGSTGLEKHLVEDTQGCDQGAQLKEESNNLYVDAKRGLVTGSSKTSENQALLKRGLLNVIPDLRGEFATDVKDKDINLGKTSKENDENMGSNKSYQNCKKNEEGNTSKFPSSCAEPSGVGKLIAKYSDDTHKPGAKYTGFNKLSIPEDKGNITHLPGYLKPVKEACDGCGMKRKYYGVLSEKKPKTIILLGASGSGKTTLVNFVANYFSGVKSADGEVVHVVGNSNDVRSRTTSITAYTFCSGANDTPFTIIDTPGLNDSSGAEVRDHIQSLKTFLANAASQNLEVHVIGFVAQAHLVRLTSSERLVMDYVSTLFGQDITEHFVTFVTFSDYQEIPPVVEAMKNYGVKCNLFLKFNNSAISNNKTDEVDDLDRVYWKIGCKSWKKVVKSLENLPALSVNAMKTVQNEMYATTVIETAERNLRAELKAYITYSKGLEHQDKEVICTGEQVWELATVLKCLKSFELSCTLNIVDVLIPFADEVFKENRVNVRIGIWLLSLVPSRNLFEAGLQVLQSMAPLYKHVDENSKKWRNPTTNQVSEVSHCSVCVGYHKVERVTSKRDSTALILYECRECSCNANVHITKLADEETSESSQYSSFDVNKLLQHTRKCLTEILSEYSIPGYEVPVDYYLRHISNCTAYNFGELLKQLLKLT